MSNEALKEARSIARKTVRYLEREGWLIEPDAIESAARSACANGEKGDPSYKRVMLDVLYRMSRKPLILPPALIANADFVARDYIEHRQENWAGR